MSQLFSYRFDVNWLKDGFAIESNIDQAQNLSEKEKEYLKTIHRRPEAQPKTPSKQDIKELKKAYGEMNACIVCCF